MGLTTWGAAPDGKIVKSDVSIAKNYLNEKEMSYMERIVQDRMFVSDYDKFLLELEDEIKR